MKSMKWKFFLGILISAVLLYFALRNVNPDELAAAFERADYRYAAPAVCLSLISIWFRAVRWKYLLNPIKEIRLMNLVSSTAIGFMANGVLPARLGEFIRAYVIGRKEGISKSSAFATIVFERILDGMTILVFFIVVFLGYSRDFPAWLHNIVYMASGFYLFSLVFMIFLRLRTEAATRFVGFFLKPFPEKPKTVMAGWLQSFVDGLGIIRSVKNVIIASLYSILVWLPNALVIYVIARSFGMELPVSGAFVILIIVCFGIMIPSAPAYLGTIQYCSVAGLSLYGVTKASALSFSVIYHICSFFPVMIVGFIFLLIEGYSLMELRDSAGGKNGVQ